VQFHSFINGSDYLAFFAALISQEAGINPA
jgi:hypothetical protein